MIIDTSLLVYSCIRQLPEHERAYAWLESALSGPKSVAIPWESLLSFVRITTDSRILTPPLALADAWRQVESWLSCEYVWSPTPTDRHAEVLGAILRTPQVAGHMIHDAHLAALAIEHGLTVCTNDTDFARFPGVKWMNPLLTH